MAFLIAIARVVMDGAGGSSSVMRGNAPKTSRVGIKPLGPAESLTAFTAICRQTSFSACVSSTMMLYARLRT
jgi:hypothetical protein